MVISNFRFFVSDFSIYNLRSTIYNRKKLLFQVSQIPQNEIPILFPRPIEVKSMDAQRPRNEIIKLVMVTDMDNLLRSGSKDLTNSFIKRRRLFYLTKIRGR